MLTDDRHAPTSQPVGTTVRIEGFLEQFPARKQAAMKTVAKMHAAIKHLLKSYALARPAVRFSLRILKSSDAGWSYSPSSEPTGQGAAMKLFRTPAAGTCFWETFNEVRYEFQALLPCPSAGIALAVERLGQWISIDSWPVSSPQRDAEEAGFRLSRATGQTLPSVCPCAGSIPGSQHRLRSRELRSYRRAGEG